MSTIDQTLVSCNSTPSMRGRVRTLAGLSGGVTAVGTSRLLDVEGTAACISKSQHVSSSSFSSYPVPPEVVPALSKDPRFRRGSIRRSILTTSPAEGVRLVVALSETGGTLRCYGC